MRPLASLYNSFLLYDVLQRRAPEGVKSLLTTRLSNHSGVALAELTHLFGRLDPRDDRTGASTRRHLGSDLLHADAPFVRPFTECAGVRPAFWSVLSFDSRASNREANALS
jgi:hypothetical protein